MSSLATALISDGYFNVTVLDVSHVAVERQIAGQRLIQGIVADITNWKPEGRYDVWHGRAVLLFLDTTAAIASYRRALDLAVSPGGHLIIATFAPDGPALCSGLAVRRYAMSDLIQVPGPDYQPEASETFVHETPAGAVQSFHVGRFRRRAAADRTFRDLRACVREGHDVIRTQTDFPGPWRRLRLQDCAGRAPVHSGWNAAGRALCRPHGRRRDLRRRCGLAVE